MAKVVFAALIAVLSGVAVAQGETYPSRPITMMVGFPPGGPTDTLARILGDAMGHSLNQTIVIETVSGASGMIATGRVVHANPDGYTIGIGNWTSHVGSAAIYPLDYDVFKDLQPIALLAASPLWILGKNALPPKTAPELITWLKTRTCCSLDQGNGEARACLTRRCRPFSTIDSGDIISFPDTWSHFLNQMQPGVAVDTLAKLRVDNPGRGPHSIIGPIAVNKAEPGDVLEIRYQRIRPYEWGAVFNNPCSLGTGLLPQDYAQGQIKYIDLDLGAMKGKFMPKITVPLKPFQGTLGLAPPDGYFPPSQPRCRRARTQAILISASCPRVRPSTSRYGSQVRSSTRATVTPCRVTARFRSPRLRRA